MSLLSLNHADAFADVIFDTVREPLLVLDGALRVVVANKAFYAAFHEAPARTEGCFLYELGDGQWDIPDLRQLLEEILPQDTQVEDFVVEHTFEPLGARTMLLNARKVHRPQTMADVVLLAIEDITDRLEAERKLRASEERFRLMVENARDYAIFSMDDDRQILSWNTGAQRVLGWTEREAIGQSADMIFTAEERAAGAPAREQARASEQGRAEDIRWHVRKDGSLFWASGSMFRLEDGSGSPQGFVKILRDKTEQKIAEDALRHVNEALEGRVEDRTRELQKSYRALESRNQELQDFAYVASHDLQEPLRKITTFAGLLRSEHANHIDEDGISYLERMESAAGRMSRLLNDLLSFSRVVSRGQPFKPVDLGEELRRALEDMEMVLTETGAQIETEPLPTVEADPSQMYQLFSNLVANAVKFSQDGVTPRVHVRGCMTDRDGLPFAEVTVEDNGIGFDEKYMDRIFAPFQRLHSRKEFPGTGMGLAICKRIVDRHGGVLTARSRQGEGSTFIVSLPLRQPKEI